MEIETSGETLLTHRQVLIKTSEYFDKCLKPPFRESQGRITFQDIAPKYLALYIGLAYKHASIGSLTAPDFGVNKVERMRETGVTGKMLDFVEVYKLCDRFVSHELGEWAQGAITGIIKSMHSILLGWQQDAGLQKMWMKEVAEAYEALELGSSVQTKMGENMVLYFGESINHKVWMDNAGELEDKRRFVLAVSQYFAGRLAQALATKRIKRALLK